MSHSCTALSQWEKFFKKFGKECKEKLPEVALNAKSLDLALVAAVARSVL